MFKQAQVFDTTVLKIGQAIRVKPKFGYELFICLITYSTQIELGLIYVKPNGDQNDLTISNEAVANGTYTIELLVPKI